MISQRRNINTPGWLGHDLEVHEVRNLRRLTRLTTGQVQDRLPPRGGARTNDEPPSRGVHSGRIELHAAGPEQDVHDPVRVDVEDVDSKRRTHTCDGFSA